ncbi:MAG: mechanosensitive ion channel family protein, partial [Bdellovibrio bacteriovorus]
MILKRFAALTLLWALTLAAWATGAEHQAAPSPDAELEAESVATAPVVLDGKTLFLVRGLSAFPAEERAERIRGRIEVLARDPEFRPDALSPVESELGTKLMAGDRLVMGVYDSDARLEGVSRQVLALANLERVRAAIAESRQARSGGVLLRGGLNALGATLVLAAAVGLVLWVMRRLSTGLEGR